MRIINKKYLLIILLVGVILTGVIGFNRKEKVQLDNVVLKQEVDRSSFAMYIQNDDTYEEYKDNKFPEGYDLNLNKSKCIDNSGQEIENALYVQQGKIGVKSNKSFYCYLYFDLLEEKEFDYTGSYQVFIAPKTGEYQIELWGASGGGAYYSVNLDTCGSNRCCEGTGDYIDGGKGGYVKGNIILNKHEILYIYVGSSGGNFLTASCSVGSVGGYNGGASGGPMYQVAGAGGGATDIRLNISKTGNWNDFDSLKSRIMVASGGGGTSNYKNAVTGGYGGSLTGGPGNLNIDSVQHTLATGGTQQSGGIGAGNAIETMNGKFGQGGISDSHGGGGGSGYYGGGSGHFVPAGVSSGAGGSSFISGYDGCIAIDGNSTADNIKPKAGCTEESQNVTCSYHYSGKFFTEPVMIAGNEEMPKYNGKGTMIGNTGNGHAKIKLVQ